MADQTLTQDAPTPERRERLDAVLGHPMAFLATAAVLLGLFGATFFANSDRVAPTKDPAYYTWRTEALLSEDPVKLIELEGPEKIFSAGYRVTAPILGGLLRRIPNVAITQTTVFLMVALPVLTALLLGAFAYRHRRDPLIFHAVAFASAALMLTPPFVGYLDNMLCLFFLAAALSLLEAAAASWPARIGFGMFLFLAGMTHPTTLVIFCLVLGGMAAARLVYRKFDLRSVVRDDGPMLVTAFVATLVVAAVWMIGIWGKSAPLGEAALPPPYDKDFFLDRMGLWVAAMLPLLNGPMFVIGAAGLLGDGRKAAEDELARVSIVWLAPLAGLFGFVAGLTYPYYRFFNTTLAWVLLVGVGIFFAARLFLRVAAKGGASRLALLGLVALAGIVAATFVNGFDKSGWNNASGGWLSAEEREDLDALRVSLQDLQTGRAEEPDRPVVFVIDSDDISPRIYGYTKLSGNTSRYGLPHGQIDQAYLYLGSLGNFANGEPTVVGEDTYDEWSAATLADAQAGIEASGQEPIVVVAQIFNEGGANAAIAGGEADPIAGLPAGLSSGEDPPFTLPSGGEVWVVRDGEVLIPGGSESSVPPDPGLLHALWVLAAVMMLLVPGALALRWFLPDATLADALPLSCALSLAMLSISGLVVLAIARSPMSAGIAWVIFGVCGATGVGLRLKAGARTAAV